MNAKDTKRYILQRRWLIGAVSFCFAVIIGYMIYGDFIAPQSAHGPLQQPVFNTSGVDGTPKSDTEKKAYAVPPTHPRELIIDRLGINANIVAVGTLKNNVLDAPKTAWDAGWYDQSALPGSNSGALLLDGHVNNALNTPGIFFSLHTLKTNDEIKIERGDHQLFTYRVVSVEQAPAEQVDMNKLFRSITPGKEGLNLITCGGEYDKARSTYKDRVMIYAERIS